MKNLKNTWWHACATYGAALLMLAGSADLAHAARERITQQIGDLNAMVANLQNAKKIKATLSDDNKVALYDAFRNAYDPGKYGKRSRAEEHNAEKVIQKLGYTSTELKKAADDVRRKRRAKASAGSTGEGSTAGGLGADSSGDSPFDEPDTDSSAQQGGVGGNPFSEEDTGLSGQPPPEGEQIDANIDFDAAPGDTAGERTIAALNSLYIDMVDNDVTLQKLNTQRLRVAKDFNNNRKILSDEDRKVEELSKSILVALALMIQARINLRANKPIQDVPKQDLQGNSQLQSLYENIGKYVKHLQNLSKAPPAQLADMIQAATILSEFDKQWFRDKATEAQGSVPKPPGTAQQLEVTLRACIGEIAALSRSKNDTLVQNWLDRVQKFLTEYSSKSDKSEEFITNMNVQIGRVQKILATLPKPQPQQEEADLKDKERVSTEDFLATIQANIENLYTMAVADVPQNTNITERIVAVVSKIQLWRLKVSENDRKTFAQDWARIILLETSLTGPFQGEMQAFVKSRKELQSNQIVKNHNYKLPKSVPIELSELMVLVAAYFKNLITVSKMLHSTIGWLHTQDAKVKELGVLIDGKDKHVAALSSNDRAWVKEAAGKQLENLTGQPASTPVPTPVPKPSAPQPGVQPQPKEEPKKENEDKEKSQDVQETEAALENLRKASPSDAWKMLTNLADRLGRSINPAETKVLADRAQSFITVAQSLRDKVETSANDKNGWTEAIAVLRNA